MYGSVECMNWAPNYLTLGRYKVLSRKFKRLSSFGWPFLQTFKEKEISTFLPYRKV